MISILLSTIHDPKETIANIRASNCPIEYEIVLGGHDRALSNVDVDKLYLQNENLGSVDCLNKLYKLSKGDHILVAVDDHFLSPNWWNCIQELDALRFRYNRKVITIGNPCPLPDKWGGPWELHNINTGCNVKHLTATFPVFTRDTIENYLDGIIFNESFYHHHVDIWLGHYLSFYNEPVTLSSTAKMIQQQHRVNFAMDRTDEAKCHELITLLKTKKINYGYKI